MELVRFGYKSKYESVKPDKTILGGKGAGLVEMTNYGMIPVPPGFIVPTSACKEFRGSDTHSQGAYLTDLQNKVYSEYQALAADVGQPVLVSVRSGAPVSMPGMMDTVLNVGLTTESLPHWVAKMGERAAYDSYRRLIHMLGSTAFGVPHEAFERALGTVKAVHKAGSDQEMSVEALKDTVGAYKKVFQATTQKEFPDTAGEQLAAAVEAVLRSWDNERAVTYRKINKIDDQMGTAVTVQTMVFGNLNDNSGSGVLFSRDGATGENELVGEFLVNAQGEDVVAGVRTPMRLLDLKAKWPKVMDELNGWAVKLEQFYRDMVDIEFTVQDGQLFILQCRAGKRTALAAFVIAFDLVSENLITKKEAGERVTAEQLKVTKRRVIDPSFSAAPNFTGIHGSYGVASGRPVFSAKEAVESADNCILVTHETDPDDIAGMNVAVGVLTATGGQTSHAAVVARGMNKPCVVGVAGIVSAVKDQQVTKITIDGGSGRVWFNQDVPVIDNSANWKVAEVVKWAADANGALVIQNIHAAESLKEGSVVWVPSENDGFPYEMFEMLKKRGVQVTIDFRSQSDAVNDDGDGPLNELYGQGDKKTVPAKAPDSLIVQSTGEWMNPDNSVDLQHVSVIGMPAEVVRAHKLGGLKNIKSVSVGTIEDLLDGGPVVIRPELSKVLRPADVAKVAQIVQKSGGDFEIVPQDVEIYPAEYQFYRAKLGAG